jgi:hypothetical protein
MLASIAVAVDGLERFLLVSRRTTPVGSFLFLFLTAAEMKRLGGSSGGGWDAALFHSL